MKKVFALSLCTLFAATSALAFGPHDNNCVDCHSLHEAKGKAILAVAPNTAEKNPGTGKGAEGDLALCLGCHSEAEGIMPINLTSTHPVGVKPAKVKVPADLLRPDGSLGCMSCHDPHPSNPNYKYLQGKIAKSSEMGEFCALCHAEKIESSKPAKAAAPAVAPAVAPKAAPPAAPKR